MIFPCSGNRFYPRPGYYFGDVKEPPMLIPDIVRDCVAFIKYNSRNRGPRLGGTVFFLSYLSESDQVIAHFAITARHVIEGIDRYTDDKEVILRVNRQNQAPFDLVTHCPHWLFHPTDSTADVAILPFELEGAPSDFDQKFLDVNAILDRASPWANRLGVGEEVFVVGLFQNHAGRKRNIPIVRMGNISAKPTEPVQTEWNNNEIDAYLIESRSLGGLSGSPVFASAQFQIPATITTNQQTPVFSVFGEPASITQMSSTYAPPMTGPDAKQIDQPAIIEPTSSYIRHFALLGLVHGHIGLPCFVEDYARARRPKDVNMGLALVVPSDKIWETISQQKIIEHMAAVREKHRRSLTGDGGV
jgi:hypothetical protein